MAGSNWSTTQAAHWLWDIHSSWFRGQHTQGIPEHSISHSIWCQI